MFEMFPICRIKTREQDSGMFWFFGPHQFFPVGGEKARTRALGFLSIDWVDALFSPPSTPDSFPDATLRDGHKPVLREGLQSHLPGSRDILLLVLIVAFTRNTCLGNSIFVPGNWHHNATCHQNQKGKTKGHHLLWKIPHCDINLTFLSWKNCGPSCKKPC